MKSLLPGWWQTLICTTCTRFITSFRVLFIVCAENEFIHFRYILKTIAHNCCCFYSCALTSLSSVVVIFENAHRLRLRFHYLFFRINEFDHTSLLIAAFGGGNPGTQQTPRSQTVRIFLGSLLTTCFPKRNIWPSLRRGKEGPLVPEEFKEGVRLVWI